MSRAVVAVLSSLVLLGVLTPVSAGAATTVRYGSFVPVAGIGAKGYSGDGQRATDARISDTGGIAVGADGTLYLADQWSGRIRAVGRDGVIDTVPGGRALRSPATDGPEVNGLQYSPSDRPYDVAPGPDGTLYVIGHDYLRALAPDGTSTKILDAEDTQVMDPKDLAFGGGALYLAGPGRVARILPTGAVTILAGGGDTAPADAEGRPATEAFVTGYGSGGYGISVAATDDGTVYLVAKRDRSDDDYLALYRIDPDGTLHLVAGAGEPGFAGDGGPAVKARLSGDLGGVAVAGDSVYVYDRGNGVVRVIDRDGDIDTISPPAVAARGIFGGALAAGPGGDLYVKSGARVYRLSREAAAPEPRRAGTPDYPDPYAGEDAGTVHTVAGSGKEEKIDERKPPVPAEQRGRLRLAVAPNGDRYYSDAGRNVVVRLTSGGASTVVAGTGNPVFSGDGGPAAKASLNAPAGLAFGPDGSLYVADAGNNRLRRIDPSGVITTVAGTGEPGVPGGYFGEVVTVSGDGGPATAATVTPTDVAVAPDGTLYVAEGGDKRISRITPDGMISTFAGGGKRWMDDADGHPAREADLFEPLAVALGRDGSVYFIDNGVEITNPAVRMVDPAGIVRTVAGDSYRDEDEAGFGGDGGPGTTAELNNPLDIATGPDGLLYIADSYNNRIRVLDPAGVITTFAGTGERADTGDGGAPEKAAITEPRSVAVGADGSVQVINGPGDRIRVVDGGVVSTDEIDAPVEEPRHRATDLAIDARGLAVDHDGNLFLRRSLGAEVYVVDRHGMATEQHDDQLDAGVTQVEFGPDGSRYTVVQGVVTRVTGDGDPEVVAGGGPLEGDVHGKPATIASFKQIVDVTVSAKGLLYVAVADAVYRVGEDGTLARVFRGTDVSAVAVGPAGDVYVAAGVEERSDLVYRVTPDGARSVFAGGADDEDYDRDDTGDGEDATDVYLYGMSDVVVDGGGNVYVGTYDGVRRIDQDGVITTVVENPAIDGSRMQLGPLAVDRAGNVYYGDPMRHAVQVVVRPGELSGPFPWGTAVWLTLGVVALLGAAYVGRLWWLRRPAA